MRARDCTIGLLAVRKPFIASSRSYDYEAAARVEEASSGSGSGRGSTAALLLWFSYVHRGHVPEGGIP